MLNNSLSDASGTGTNLKVGAPVQSKSGGGHRVGKILLSCPSTFWL